MCKSFFLHILCPACGAKHRRYPYMIDIREYPEVVDVINGIINNGGTAEIKNEKRRGDDNLVVVEIVRMLRTKKPRA